MRLAPRHDMRLYSPALHGEQFCVPNQTHRSLDLLAGTPESPQEHCHKTRRTLMSPQERKIAWCITNQIEMKPISPALAP